MVPHAYASTLSSKKATVNMLKGTSRGLSGAFIPLVMNRLGHLKYYDIPYYYNRIFQMTLSIRIQP